MRWYHWVIVGWAIASVLAAALWAWFWGYWKRLNQEGGDK